MDSVNKGWKDASVFKSTDFSFRGPQHMHGGSQQSVTQVLGDTISSSGFLVHQSHMMCSDVHAKKKSTLKNWNKWVNLLLWGISSCWSYYFKILGALTSMIMSQGWILWSILAMTREWPLLGYFLTLCVILMLRSISCSEWRPCSWSWIKKTFPEVQGLIFITDSLVE